MNSLGASPSWHDVDAGRCARLSREMLDRTDLGYCLLEVRARVGEPVDLRFVDINAALEAWGPFWGILGRRARRTLPSLGEEAYEQFRQVVLRGQATEFVLRSDLTGGRPVRIRACRLGHPKERLVGVLVLDMKPGLRAPVGQ